MFKYYRVKSVKRDAYIGECYIPDDQIVENCGFDKDYGEEVVFEEISKEEFDILWDAPII